MKLMPCPLNGPRNMSEFSYGGEVRVRPEPGADPAVVADYVFHKHNQPEVTREWWCHVPTSTWFIAERNLATDEIVRTYLPSDPLFAEGGTP
ncbi:sarcosine oxidase subunit delta [Pararhodospirillum oryzae]|uniref:Sarcosine oxidase subunit delta n=1 Tax=Pararhodospirillum oryzae TaxID=478448 RepID=A0A512HBR0_9PROT|nr:sarcosine oxidase subunit delta [Pararhodospirillum oryzae]GEO82878.1 sarcosine oxidase subunit delta [Pararhodospirillum oryzae]